MSPIFEKVKKLLELAASPNEHEARLAFLKAQELIAKHSLNMAENNNTEGIVEREYTLKIPPSSGFMETFPEIAHAISQPFGVYILVSARKRSAPNKIELVGFPTNTQVAEYAIDCVLNQCFSDLHAAYKENPSLGFAHNFWKGVSKALNLRFRVDSINEKGLIIYDKVKQYMDKFPSTNFLRTQVDGKSGLEEGLRSGESAQLRPGIVSTQSGKLLK